MAFTDNFLQLGAMFGMAGSSGMIGGMFGGLLGNLFGGGQQKHHHHRQPQQGGQDSSPQQQHIQDDMLNAGMGGANMSGFNNGFGQQGSVPFGGGWGNPGSGCPSQRPPWSVTNTGGGQDSIDLGNYTLTANKANSQWVLTNKRTGQATNVSGDPHVNQTDGNNWTFKNNMSFQLDDGTRITVKTTPYGNGQTLSDELDISKGGQGMVVSGLASNDGSPLKVTTGVNGYGLDAQNFNVPEIYEGTTDWETFAGQTVNQGLVDRNNY